MPIEIDTIVAGRRADVTAELIEDWIGELPSITEQIGQLAVPPDAELSVLVTDDDQVAALNQQYRDRPGPTNVLSFPVQQVAVGETPPALLGDLVFAMPTIGREAEEQGKEMRAHFQHLFVHGLLHLFGYDHLTQDQASQMEQLEIKVLAALGLENPYQ